MNRLKGLWLCAFCFFFILFKHCWIGLGANPIQWQLGSAGNHAGHMHKSIGSFLWVFTVDFFKRYTLKGGGIYHTNLIGRSCYKRTEYFLLHGQSLLWKVHIQTWLWHLHPKPTARSISACGILQAHVRHPVKVNTSALCQSKWLWMLSLCARGVAVDVLYTLNSRVIFFYAYTYILTHTGIHFYQVYLP